MHAYAHKHYCMCVCVLACVLPANKVAEKSPNAIIIIRI